mmetsp:Transcript_12985/g.29855  ORF Transcript_12985/g.29855 Transcript_12985/m.29855 type:complete len:222 (+) Transcript_12985:1330-1995(+)
MNPDHVADAPHHRARLLVHKEVDANTLRHGLVNNRESCTEVWSFGLLGMGVVHHDAVEIEAVGLLSRRISRGRRLLIAPTNQWILRVALDELFQLIQFGIDDRSRILLFFPADLPPHPLPFFLIDLHIQRLVRDLHLPTVVVTEQPSPRVLVGAVDMQLKNSILKQTDGIVVELRLGFFHRRFLSETSTFDDVPNFQKLASISPVIPEEYSQLLARGMLLE